MKVKVFWTQTVILISSRLTLFLLRGKKHGHQDAKSCRQLNGLSPGMLPHVWKEQVTADRTRWAPAREHYLRPKYPISLYEQLQVLLSSSQRWHSWGSELRLLRKLQSKWQGQDSDQIFGLWDQRLLPELPWKITHLYTKLQ